MHAGVPWQAVGVSAMAGDTNSQCKNLDHAQLAKAAAADCVDGFQPEKLHSPGR